MGGDPHLPGQTLLADGFIRQCPQPGICLLAVAHKLPMLLIRFVTGASSRASANEIWELSVTLLNQMLVNWHRPGLFGFD